MLGRGSGGDVGRGLVPIHVGSRHLIRVLEAEARKLERAPLNRQVIVAITRIYLGSRLKRDAHRSSVRPSGVHEFWFSCLAAACRAGELELELRTRKDQRGPTGPFVPSVVPDVYGEPVVYVCTCRTVHGVVHLCALCRVTHTYRPSGPWVEGERCRTCLVEERERLEAAMAVVDRKLRHAVHALDPESGERIPPLFLTPKGWVPELKPVRAP